MAIWDLNIGMVGSKMSSSKLNGHNVVFVDGQWLYGDAMTPTAGDDRPCGHCGMVETNAGYDGCIGTIPGAMNACCGHGNNDDAYIQWPDGSIDNGAAAVNKMKINLK